MPKRRKRRTHGKTVELSVKEECNDILSQHNNLDSASSLTEPSAKEVERKILKTEQIVLVEDFMVKKRKLDKIKALQVKEDDTDCEKHDNIVIKKGVEEAQEEEKEVCKQIRERELIHDNVSYISVVDSKYHGVLFLKQRQVVAFSGYAQVAVLTGAVEINGFCIPCSSTPTYFDMFSPTSSSLLYLKDMSTSNMLVENLKDRLSIISREEERNIVFSSCGKDIYSCVLIKRMETPIPDVLSKLSNFQDLLKSPEIFPQPFGMTVLQTDEWRDVIDDMLIDISNRDCQCSVMLCGGKDVGKSSFCRYIVNNLLLKHDTVFYLECDCGQTEFTPPAVLSLVKVTKPLFGPPFSHHLKPVKAYFYGHISPQDTPSEYVKLIQLLFEEYQTEYLNVGPLVINQQGWVRGLGLSLLIDCLRVMSPCFTIQINCSTIESRNLLSDLSEDFIKTQSGWSVDKDYESLKRPSHPGVYLKLKSAVISANANPSKNKSLMTRNLSMTSYFSGLFEREYESFCERNKKCSVWLPPSLSTLQPYCIQWHNVAIHCMHQKIPFDLLMHGFNMAVVCLAHVNEEMIEPVVEDNVDLPRRLCDQPLATYLGLGIVRNIDPVDRTFYVLTPEPLDVLDNVNALLLGNIQLPHLYLLEDKSSNQPYYCLDYPSVSSKVSSGMKPRFNLKRRPSRLKNTFGERS